jgi:hypothetical protein
VSDDLVTHQVEIDPVHRAAALRAAQNPAIEGAGRRQIVNRNGQVKGAQFAHGRSMILEVAAVS